MRQELNNHSFTYPSDSIFAESPPSKKHLFMSKIRDLDPSRLIAPTAQLSVDAAKKSYRFAASATKSTSSAAVSLATNVTSGVVQTPGTVISAAGPTAQLSVDAAKKSYRIAAFFTRSTSYAAKSLATNVATGVVQTPGCVISTVVQTPGCVISTLSRCPGVIHLDSCPQSKKCLSEVLPITTKRDCVVAAMEAHDQAIAKLETIDNMSPDRRMHYTTILDQ